MQPPPRMNTPMTDQEIVEHLNDLRQLDYDAIQTYEQASRHAGADAEVRSDLERFRIDHERHLLDLAAVIAQHGGVAKPLRRDAKGLLLEGLTRLRSATGLGGALRAMRTNERLTNRRYDEALDLPLPADVLVVLRANLDDERRHLAAIEAHIVRLEEDAAEDDEDERERERERADDIPHVRM